MSKYTPVPKVRNPGIAGAATIVLMFAAASLGHPLPAEVAGAMVFLVMALVGYLTPDE